MELPQILFSIYIGLNAVTFLVFGADKWQAASGTRRTPEKVLWFLCLIGGSLGGLIAMQTFRHKTKKTSFQFVMGLIVVMQLGAIYIIADYFGYSL